MANTDQARPVDAALRMSWANRSGSGWTPGAGSVHPVELTIPAGILAASLRVGETRWTTSLFPKDGGYVVPLKDLVRKAEGIDVGDTLKVRLTVDV